MSVPGETVAAIATAQGRGALAVIRISGPGAFAVCGKCIGQSEKFALAEPRYVGVYDLVSPDGGGFVDRVCAAKFAGPQSYTGEDMVEISCHGGTGVAALVLRCVLGAGARMAEPGEFTRRAVVHGKMDARGAEATLALIESASEEEHTRAAAYYSGKATGEAERLIESMLGLSASIEAGIEAEGEGVADAAAAREQLALICNRLAEEVEEWEAGRGGEREVVVAGLTNAGKSTLFNLLLGTERALVASTEGTTRDYVAERFRAGDIWLRLVDTAGLGHDDGGVGAAGVARSWEKIRDADAVVWVSPLDRSTVTEEEKRLCEVVGGGKLLVLQSKADLEREGTRRGFVEQLGAVCLSVNLLDPADRVRAREWVAGNLSKGSGCRLGDLIANERHAQVLREALAEGRHVLSDGNAGMDLVADGVRRMAAAVQGLDPRTGGEELLGRILSRFCVGK